MTWTLRRMGVLAAAALLATAISAKPLNAAGENLQPAADGKKTSEAHKTREKTGKTHTKTKKEIEQTTGNGQMQGYRPDATPGSGY
jgi:hypothetical protein